MINYKFGNIECKIDWECFLIIKIKEQKLYKSNFKNFPDFYEFLDKNINDISNILFDNFEYNLENGKLHNLYGSATINYYENNYIGKAFSKRFYINGEIVYYEGQPCKKLENFETGEIYHYEELTKNKTGRTNGKFYIRKENIDYIKHYIDLQKLRNKDKRKQKLKNLNEMD